MKYYYSLICCSALLAHVVAAVKDGASSTYQEKTIIKLLRRLQAATRPPKTPPPTFPATRPPKTAAPTLAPVTLVPGTIAPATPSPTTLAPVASTPQSIAQTVCSNDDFFTLCSYLELTGLYDTLNSADEYTLFAATNAAFDQLTSSATLTDDEIKGLLMYHVAPNVLLYEDLMKIAPGDVETMVPSVPSLTISVSIGTDGEVLLNGRVKITTPDIAASNGYIQVISEIIVPEIPPTSAPITLQPTLKPIEVVTPAPTLKPIEVVTPVPSLKPTEAPVAQVVTIVPTPTPEPSSKPPTYDIASNPPTSASTTPVSMITPIGTSAPTGEKWGAFSKAGKSGSKSGSKTPKADAPKVGGKSSSKSGKSIKVEGKTVKESTPGFHAMEDISLQQASFDVHERLNARFKADWNDALQLRGCSFYVTIAALTAVAWCWQM
jgi:uncharacterized surface protein with fasciclin (FAS1) repeats